MALIKQNNLDIDLVEIKEQDNLVVALARVFEGKKQYGFGKDGSVDIERFRFVNLPKIVCTEQDAEGECIKQKGLTLEEAVLLGIEQTMRGKKQKYIDSKITKDKVGNTTTTVYYTAGVASPASGSYMLAMDNKVSYTAARDAASADNRYAITGAAFNVLQNSKISSTFYVRRADLHFDTSAISAGDTISSASLSLYSNSTGGADNNNDQVILLDVTNNGSVSDPLATADFNDFGTTSIGSKDLTDLTNQGAYVSINLTATTVINKGGKTRIGLRMKNDIDNTEPNAENNLRLNLGSAPYITVEHAAGAGNIKKINNIAWANVKKINNIAVANIKKINGISAK